MFIPETLSNFALQAIGERVRSMTGSKSNLEDFTSPKGDVGLFGPDSISWKVRATRVRTCKNVESNARSQIVIKRVGWCEVVCHGFGGGFEFSAGSGVNDAANVVTIDDHDVLGHGHPLSAPALNCPTSSGNNFCESPA